MLYTLVGAAIKYRTPQQGGGFAGTRRYEHLLATNGCNYDAIKAQTAVKHAAPNCYSPLVQRQWIWRKNKTWDRDAADVYVLTDASHLMRAGSRIFRQCVGCGLATATATATDTATATAAATPTAAAAATMTMLS